MSGCGAESGLITVDQALDLILDKTQGDVKIGTKIQYQGIDFEVLEMDENRIKMVKITQHGFH